VKKTQFIISLTIFLFLTSFLWQPACAQNETHFEKLEVSLSPDVDQSTVTVNLDIKLAEDTPLPKTLSIQIPVNAQLQSIANQLEDGALSPAENVITTTDSWQDVELTASSLAFQINYIDPNLTKEDGRWIFDFEWLSIYTLDSLYIMVQQPSDISSISAVPSLIKLSDETTGTAYYSGEMGSIDAGESWSLSLIYTKAACSVVDSPMEIVPAMPIDETTAGRTASPLSVVMWLLAVAVAVLIMVGLYYWRFRSNISKKHNRIVKGVEIMNPEKQVVFCHECGMLSQTGDGYCRNCGTQLHKVGKYSPPTQG